MCRKYGVLTVHHLLASTSFCTATFYILFARGIGTIDIELTNIDINQCDPETDEATGNEGSSKVQHLDDKSVDVFRGTHHCQPTTKVGSFLFIKTLSEKTF